jgi:hypothetical protein
LETSSIETVVEPPRRIETVLKPWLVIARSGRESTLKSPTVTENAFLPTGKSASPGNVPPGAPSRMVTSWV